MSVFTLSFVDSRLFMLLLVGGVFIFGAGTTTPVFSEDIGITLSNTCRVLLTSDTQTNCPTYEELMILFPDTSDQNVSGSLNYTDGFFERGRPQMKNHFEFYAFSDKNRLWIDPPIDLFDKIKIVTITSNNFVYPIKNQIVNSSEIKIGQGRYIDDCNNAIITSDNFFFLTGDTIQHLLLDCEPGTTNFNEVSILEWNRTNHDITTSAKYQLEQRVKYIKENCIQQFHDCNEPENYVIKLKDSLSMEDKL